MLLNPPGAAIHIPHSARALAAALVCGLLLSHTAPLHLLLLSFTFSCACCLLTTAALTWQLFTLPAPRIAASPLALKTWTRPLAWLQRGMQWRLLHAFYQPACPSL